ncbi:hypothetical protein M5J74_23785 [Chroococcidiopsis sp. CCNUC1]|nr:hypothetical protein [Chroococcidiopsis sp. CCNUC1]URD49330.1 hypothetical protein M5J74_23785 [Chroococcidiopsis sp. CCNUC1]
MFRFWKLTIDFRLRHSNLHRSRYFTGSVNQRGLADISWHGCQLYSPGWNDPNARVLAFTLGGFNEEADIHVMLNMYWEELEFEIPAVAGKQWYRAIDTAQNSPLDIAEPGKETLVTSNTYFVQSRSVVVLISQ